MISELVAFAQDFKDEDDDLSIIDKIKNTACERMVPEHTIGDLCREIERVVKMFYLSAKVKGQLKQYKEDYFK